MKVKIKDMPISNRPMERLINKGVEYLNDEELLAVLIRTGNKEVSSKVLSSFILNEIGGIKKLKNVNYQSLIKIKGIGKTKACTIMAAIELSNRINNDIDEINDIKMTSPDIVFNYYKNKFKNKKQEYFYCLYLDNKKNLIDYKLLFIGTLNMSIIHPREIFKEAYLLSSSSIICLHNHPSGSVAPSEDDFNVTRNLIDAGKLLGIEVVDHIIISNNEYYSFFENNKM